MQALAPTIALFLGSAVVIYFACEYFVNGVEWVGRRFDIDQKATGTILAAAGTALPESVVTFVAVVFGTTPAAKEIGVGAAVGGPLVLSTFAYAVVGWTLFAVRRPMPADSVVERQFKTLARDQSWFLVIFVGVIALGLVAFPGKAWLGLAFVGAYGAYFWKEMRGEGGDIEGELEPLKIAPRQSQPSATLAVVQTSAALAVIFFASRTFVDQMQILGPHLGLKPQLLALLLSPIATELPEILNAVIWVREGKIKLALANISGAMMIQATVPSALGVIFTPWRLDPALILAGATAAVSTALLFLLFRRGRMSRAALSAFGLLYVAFALALVVMRL
jgi:cation:H+ antiporter